MTASDWIAIVAVVVAVLTAIIGGLVTYSRDQAAELHKERLDHVQAELTSVRAAATQMTANFLDAVSKMTATFVDAMSKIETTFTTRAATYSAQLESRFNNAEASIAANREALTSWELSSTQEHSKIWQALPSNYVTKDDFNRGIDQLEKLFDEKFENLTNQLSSK